MLDKIMKLLGYERLENILIPAEFKRHPPRFEKMQFREFYYEFTGKFYVPIVLRGFELVDGYTSYIIAKEFGKKYVPVKRR